MRLAPPEIPGGASGQSQGETVARDDIDENYSQGWDSLTPEQRELVANPPAAGIPRDIIQSLIIMDGSVVVPRVGFTEDGSEGARSYVDAQFTDYVRARLDRERE